MPFRFAVHMLEIHVPSLLSYDTQISSTYDSLSDRIINVYVLSQVQSFKHRFVFHVIV